MLRVLLRNSVSNWAGYAINLVVTFFLTPFVLHELGVERYGVWTLVIGITGYYGILDLGFRGGVTQYLTRYLAKEEYEKTNQVICTALVTLAVVALIVAFCSLIIGILVPHLFDVSSGLERELSLCIWIVGFSAAAQVLFFPFSAVFSAKQRFDLANLIGIATRILSAFAVILCLRLGYGLVGISVAVCLCNIFDYGIRLCVALRLIPFLKFHLRFVRISRLKEIWSFGLWNFLSSVSRAIFLESDALVIAIFLPISFVTPYALAGNLMRHLIRMLDSIRIVFFPTATQLHSQDDIVGLRTLYINGSRCILVVAALVGVLTWFWAEDFFRLWIGENYTTGTSSDSVPALFRVLLLAFIFTQMTGVGTQILLGAKRVKPLSVFYLLEAVANLVLSVFLIQTHELMGVAISTAITTFSVRVVIIPWVVSGTINIPLTQYWIESYMRPLAVALCFSLVVMPLSLNGSYTWMQLILQGSFAGLIGIVIAIFIGLKRQERERILYARIRSVVVRLKTAVMGS